MLQTELTMLQTELTQDAPSDVEDAPIGDTFRWVSSIREIGRSQWTSCFPHDDVLQSYDLHAATEAAGLSDVVFDYLVREGTRGVTAIVPCFRFRMSLTVVAPDSIARVVDAVRRVMPGFLYLDVFVVGTPIAICKDLLGLRPGLGDPAREVLLRAICDEVCARAKALDIGLVMIKEITARLLPDVAAILAERFTVVESPATTYLYLGEPGRTSYRGRLRKKYRTLMNARQAKLAEAGMRWEVLHDFAPYASDMHALYLQVLHKSKIRFETLTPEFFAQLPHHLGERVLALLCFKGDRLVACELVLQDGSWTHPLYLGIDYGERDEGALYFNSIYRIIALSEAQGRAVVQLGQTSYAAKASIGAVIARLYLALHHTQPGVNAFLRRLGSLMFPPTPVPRSQRVFRDMEENDAGLAHRGIDFERTRAASDDVQGIVTRVFRSVRELPRGVWDEKVACGHPFKSSAFLRCLEESFPERRFGYAVMTRGAQLVGLAVLTEETLDLGLLLPSWVGAVTARLRRLRPELMTLRLGMVGTFETAQRHWWFDAEAISTTQFVDALTSALSEVCGRSALWIVRDFTEGDAQDTELARAIRAHGYVSIDNHPIAVVPLDGCGIDQHFRRLKKKSRQNLRKKLDEARRLGLVSERVRDFRSMIDECYPLYLQVHERSTEFKRNPLPRRFFEQISERLAEVSSLLTVRTETGRLCAFVLTGTSGSVSNPFVIGMDYALTEEHPAYHYVVWQELIHAAAHGCREVDLGLTSYFVKQTVGAEIKGMTMSARIPSAGWRLVLQPLLPTLLGEKQPERRRSFREDAPGKPLPSVETPDPRAPAGRDPRSSCSV